MKYYKKYKLKNKKAFSLVESLVALALFGLIVLMMSPLIMGRTQRTSEVHCVQGGSKSVEGDSADLDIAPGIEKVYVTAMREGTAGNNTVFGTKYEHRGSDAGDTYLPIYRELKLAQLDPSLTVNKIKVAVNTTSYSGKGNVAISLIYADPDTGAESTKKTITTEPFEKVEEEAKNPRSTRQGSTLRAGIPNSGSFLGPLYGVGGRGTYNDDSLVTFFPDSYRKPSLTDGFIRFEWATNCLVTEDTD